MEDGPEPPTPVLGFPVPEKIANRAPSVENVDLAVEETETKKPKFNYPIPRKPRTKSAQERPGCLFSPAPQKRPDISQVVPALLLIKFEASIASEDFSASLASISHERFPATALMGIDRKSVLHVCLQS